MNIIHYALGFPPYRKGGMTMYCLDLMEEQVLNGMEVGMIWPGRFNINNSKSIVKENKAISINGNCLVKNYEIINPAFVPLIDGISEPKEFMRKKSIDGFMKFFKKIKCDILHIHTLMGLPKEFIDAAKNINIKIVFTTHDYYGLCPNCSFMIGNDICIDDDNSRKCVQCNEHALSIKKIILLQSPFYRYVKQFKAIEYLRKNHIKNINETYKNLNDNILEESKVLGKSREYMLLREYYISMLREIDFIHFNSSNTKKIYERFIDNISMDKTMGISNKSIRNNKKNRSYDHKIRLGYLGPITIRKGFFDLITVLNNLYYDGYQQFELHIYSHCNEKIPYIVEHEPFKHEELDNVMDTIDLLIVPSLCDTFGFTVLEALSYGVPVIVSKYVGAKDLLENGKSGIIYNDLENLSEIIKDIIINHKLKLKNMNEYIVENIEIKDMISHSLELEGIYKELMRGDGQ